MFTLSPRIVGLFAGGLAPHSALLIIWGQPSPDACVINSKRSAKMSSSWWCMLFFWVSDFGLKRMQQLGLYCTVIRLYRDELLNLSLFLYVTKSIWCCELVAITYQIDVCFLKMCFIKWHCCIIKFHYVCSQNVKLRVYCIIF